MGNKDLNGELVLAGTGQVESEEPWGDERSQEKNKEGKDGWGVRLRLLGLEDSVRELETTSRC